MSEPKKRLEDSGPLKVEHESRLSDRNNHLSAVPLGLYRATDRPPSQSLLANRTPHSDVPAWLRPFFSLRVQLTSVYSMVLTLVLVAACILIYEQTATSYIAIVIAVSLILGTIIAFIFTSVLLRPLWRVTDAAQAIAIGDLEQRERLPLRLPPQDEIDRLAGSVNEMVTRLEYAEEMQHAAEQRFKRFFSDASHQLRTPLTSIRGFTEVLMRGAKDDPETVQRVLSLMKGEVERMTLLINDLLTLARLDDGQLLKKQYVDLVELASDGIAQAKGRINDEHAISLVLTTHEPVGVQADRERLKQLLFILLDNAIKHGRPAPEGRVTLQLEKQSGQAILRVIDNGEGIAKEDQEHIFDSFYRGQYRRPTPGYGTSIGVGLGLTIASAIVRAHQGSITVYSDIGAGTEFRVILPGAS
jgi:signal transduction histidine kinase